MLLYTNKANNVFGIVDEKFGDWDIWPSGGIRRQAGSPPQEIGGGRRFWRRGCRFQAASAA
jgi:hypothetical protein